MARGKSTNPRNESLKSIFKYKTILINSFLNDILYREIVKIKHYKCASPKYRLIYKCASEIKNFPLGKKPLPFGIGVFYSVLTLLASNIIAACRANRFVI